MNFAVIGLTFALVIPAELPDKTFISAVILGARHRALPVWIGAATALITQAGIAAGAGRLVALLPHRVVIAITAVLFFAGGIYLLVTTEKHDEDAAVELAHEEEARLSRPSGNTRANRSAFISILATSFIVVFLAEFGDLTQILVANLSARYQDPLDVFIGAAVAFILISGIGVIVGKTLLRFIPLVLLRRISGAALFALAIWSTVDFVHA